MVPQDASYATLEFSMNPGMQAWKLSRNELYEKVWSKAMRLLAGDYGLSDVGLAKICKRHEIPCTPVGYGAKVAAGKAGPRTPLEPASSPELESVVIHRDVPDDAQPTEPTPPESSDSEVVRELAKVRAMPVEPTPANEKLHRVAEQTLKAMETTLKANRRADHGLYGPPWEKDSACFCANVGPQSFARVAKLIDALMRTFEKVGVAVKPDNGPQTRGLQMVYLGESFSMSIRELTTRHVKQADGKTAYWNRHEYVPNGTLELRLNCRRFCGRRERVWKDGKRSKVEEAVGEVAIEMILMADGARVHAKAERARLEQTRQAEVTAAALRREREEDLARARTHIQLTEQWHAAESLRRFAAELARQLPGLEHGARRTSIEQLEAELLQTADRLDPIASKSQNALVLEELFPEPEPRWSGSSSYSQPSGRPAWLGGWPNYRRS